MVSRKISLFSMMQRGRSRSFELFQLDKYEISIIIVHNNTTPTLDDPSQPYDTHNTMQSIH